MKSALRTNFGGQGCLRWGQREIMSSTVVLTKLSAMPTGAVELGWPIRVPEELSSQLSSRSNSGFAISYSTSANNHPHTVFVLPGMAAWNLLEVSC